MGIKNCTPLEINTDGVVCVSCWQLSPKEIKNLIEDSGKIWLWVFSGVTQPPVALTVGNPFTKIKLVEGSNNNEAPTS